MTKSIEDRITEIERRLALLEKDSHPPIDMTDAVYAIVGQILRDFE